MSDEGFFTDEVGLGWGKRELPDLTEKRAFTWQKPKGEPLVRMYHVFVKAPNYQQLEAKAIAEAKQFFGDDFLLVIRPDYEVKSWTSMSPGQLIAFNCTADVTVEAHELPSDPCLKMTLSVHGDTLEAMKSQALGEAAEFFGESFSLVVLEGYEVVKSDTVRWPESWRSDAVKWPDSWQSTWRIEARPKQPLTAEDFPE